MKAIIGSSQKIIKKPVVFEIDIGKLTENKKIKGSEITTGQDLHCKLYDALWNYIFLDYRRKDNFVKVIFDKGKKFTYMTISEFVFHLIFWRTHVQYSSILKRKVEITQDFMYDLSVFDSDLMTDILEDTIKEFLSNAEEREDGIDELSYYTSLIVDDFMELMSGYCVIASNTISIYDIHQLEKRNKVFAESIHTKLDESKPIIEIQNILEAGKRRVFEAIVKDGKNNLTSYIKGKRMSSDQLAQMFFAVGPRSDVDKTILPKIMRGNFLKGYETPSDVYIDAVTGRDAQILKHITVRDSGYLSRKINISNLNTRINYNIKDCGTKHTLEYTVSSKSHLKSIDFKYMVNEDGSLHLIDCTKDEHLIGKTIQLRSHIFCSCKEHEVCMTCFGGKAKRLKGTNIGGLPSVKFANSISKRLMRAKHFTTTSALEVKNEFILKWFIIENNKLYFNPEIKNKDVYIVINRDYVEDIIDGSTSIDDDTVDNNSPLDGFCIQYGNDEERDYIESEGLFLILTDALLEENKKFIMSYDSDEVLIPMSKISKDIPIFDMVIVTEAVSLYLKQIKRLIDSSKTKGYVNPSGLVQDVTDILINMGITSTSIINLETLIYQLIKSEDKLYERSDFNDTNARYNVLPLSASIAKANIYTAFGFEKFKLQITDIDSYKKSGYGIFDPLFRTKAPDHLKPVNKNLIKKVISAGR